MRSIDMLGAGYVSRADEPPVPTGRKIVTLLGIVLGIVVGIALGGGATLPRERRR